MDLDQTLVPDRTAERLAARFGLSEELREAWRPSPDHEIASPDETTRVANIFSGIRVDDFVDGCRPPRYRTGARRLVAGLQALGARVVVVSASYALAAQVARRDLGADGAVGVELVEHDGLLSGRVRGTGVPGPCGRHICKEAVLATTRRETGAAWTVAVGDGYNDACVVRAADLGIAVEPAAEPTVEAADVSVKDLPAAWSAIEAWWAGRPD